MTSEEVVGWGSLWITMNFVDPLIPGFSYAPSDPSIYDSVQFTDQSWDQFGLGISSEAWTFGDGSNGSGPSPAHTYQADGNYTVTLNIAAPDGRTASTSQTVSIATHDVKLQSLSVPSSAVSGQTRDITVVIANHRYPEQVQVILERSNAWGAFDLVGAMVQAVPAGNAVTSFVFPYTFTASDAALGSVVFRAGATIQGYRDAQPGDNEATSGPVKVPR